MFDYSACSLCIEEHVFSVNILMDFNITPWLIVISSLSLQYGLILLGILCLSGQPSRQYCLICLHTSSPSWASVICFNLISDTGNTSTILQTKALISWSGIRFSSGLLSGCLRCNLDRASLADFMLNLASFILNLCTLGGNWSRLCIVSIGTKGL